jgi:hypothetical protein
MNLLVRATEAVAEEESGLDLAIVFGVTMFVVLALLLFLVTRLDLDR